MINCMYVLIMLSWYKSKSMLKILIFFIKTVTLPDGKYILPTKVCKHVFQKLITQELKLLIHWW